MMIPKILTIYNRVRKFHPDVYLSYILNILTLHYKEGILVHNIQTGLVTGQLETGGDKEGGAGDTR